MKIDLTIKKLLPKRAKSSHKGDFGRILILAGSKGLSGACILASNAALRSGAGLVTVGVPESLSLPLMRRLLESMMKPLPETSEGTVDVKAFSHIEALMKSQDVLGMGPGLSQNRKTQLLIQKVLANIAKPMVIDADGLNAFRSQPHLFKKKKADIILTPHPGEFTRIFGGKLSHKGEDRLSQAKQVAKQYGVILVLKGYQTIVASPKGETFINSTGNPGMATGGSGDVLLGVITALIGQKLSPYDAAKVGVYVHGLAGDMAVKKTGELSLLAGDVLDHLPSAFKKVLGR